jgi:hypothetical protein
MKSEYERRLEAAHKAYHYADMGRVRAKRHVREAAVKAYVAPLPPEPQLVTDEMLKVALYAFQDKSGRQVSGSGMTAAIEAAMRESPVIKAAQVWGSGSTVGRSKALSDALKEAGL